MVWSRAAKVKAPAYGVHAPPSIRTSVRFTPLPASSADRLNVVALVYGPLAGESVVAGGASSTTRAIVPSASAFPSRSEERSSTMCLPSPVRLKGDPYGGHAPPSIRYSVEATPTGLTPPSVACSSRGVEDVTNVSPVAYCGLPTARVVVGGTLSTK